MSAAAIVVDNLTKTYRGGQVRALDAVSLSIAPGEAVGIIGPNGAGKTTLLGCLLGFLHADAGRITVDGHEPDNLAIRAATGYLPERLVLDRWMNGRDFLEYHHALAGLPRETRRADANATLERVGLDDEAARRSIRKYSRGMLQRLGLAQALLGQPRFLFLDEPISGVDPAGVVLFRRILTELRASGATLVINSHQLDEIERVCDRVVFVNRGRLEAMQTLEAGATVARVLRVRISAAAGADRLDESLLRTLASGAGAGLLEWRAPDARFTVADDAGATRLLAALLGAGLPVIEAAPEEGRLERLFVAPPAGAAS